MDNLIYLSVSILSFVGFAIANKIFREKKSAKPMVCPLNGKCEQVLYSKYSKFFGVPMEILGMLYYAVSLCGYFLIFWWPTLRMQQIIVPLFLFSMSGLIFSIYLSSIQVFKLREMCSWCLMSAITCVLIFILTLFTGAPHLLMGFLSVNMEVIVIGYAVALVAGFVCSLLYEVLFYYYFRDRDISQLESDVLHVLSQIIFIALALVIIFNFTIYIAGVITDPEVFLLKACILSILFVSHFAYNLQNRSRGVFGLLSMISWALVIILDVLWF